MSTYNKIKALIDDLSKDANAASNNKDYILEAQLRNTISQLNKIAKCW